MRLFFIIFLSIFTTFSYANTLSLSNQIKQTNLLLHSKIYIDETQSLNIRDILDKKVAFQNNKKSFLGFGYSPKFDVWIEFSLENNTNKTIKKVVEYHNSLTTHVTFFSADSNYQAQKDGLFQIDKQRTTLHPTFNIQLNPNESKTYYIKASSYITTLIINLKLWDVETFYEHEIKHQFVFALFFGAMSILALYNLFIFFFSRDISYLYYFMYLAGIIAHHAVYVGVSSIYILNQAGNINIITYAALLVAFPIFSLALFTKSFLQTKQYPIVNKILNLFMLIVIITSVIFLLTDEFNKYRNLLPILLMLYLFFVTIYATFRRNRQAYFILIGWSAIVLAIVFMFLSSIGVFSIYSYIPYYVEASLVFEAVIFSIALAHKIKQLQIEREIANQKLISQQENEKQRLSKQVDEKTKSLKVALDEKQLLLQELNHRVKNNMQTMLSLIRLQKAKIKDENLNDVLTTIQNRISAMNHLHELFYKQDNISYVNAYEYFELVVDDIKDSYDNNIDIDMSIKAHIKIEQAIYCGIILNELITNSFKYAFSNEKGKINIELYKDENGKYTLKTSDNGIGFDTNRPTNTLGLVLVKALAKDQLKGTVNIESTDGVKVTISWIENELNKNTDSRR